MLKKLIVINTRITIFQLHVRHVRIALKKKLASNGAEQLRYTYSLGRRQSLVIGGLYPGRKRPLNPFLSTNVCVVSPYYNQTDITEIKFKEVTFILTLQNFSSQYQYSIKQSSDEIKEKY